jgi:hypothetical protein
MNFKYMALFASAMLAAAPGPVSAQNGTPDIVLDPGVACSFGLGIYVTGEFPEGREFRDKNGNLVRLLQAGKGVSLTFVNMSTGARFGPIKTGGTVRSVRYNADGTSTETLTGHNLVIFFPTDVPAGPSTVLYIGRLVYTVNSANPPVSTIQSFHGSTLDICRALGS